MASKDEFPLFYQRGEDDSGQISFPISTDDFREFISSLLSRPDTLKGSYEGTFIFTKEFIVNLDISLRNRIESQNDLLYEDSSIKVYYDDDTIEEFSSVVRFENESCKKNVTCTGFACAWKYLIRFGAELPQSQTITVSTYEGGEEITRNSDHHEFDVEFPPKVEYVIQFTNRIWAREIESILRHDHIIQACQEKVWVEKVYGHLEGYLKGISSLFFTVLIIGFFITGLFAFFSPNSISLKPLERISQAEFDSQVENLKESVVEDKIDFIISILEPALIEQGSLYSQSPEARKGFLSLSGKILAFVLGMSILSGTSGRFYFPKPRMFVLFNEKTILKYKEFSEKLSFIRRIVDFFMLSGAVGIGLGLFTNFLYDLISRGL